MLSSDLLVNWNVSVKPLPKPGSLPSKSGSLPPDVRTSTLLSASITTRGAGTGITGPIISVIWMPLVSIADSRNAFGQGDGKHRADVRDQRLGLHRSVRIA